MNNKKNNTQLKCITASQKANPKVFSGRYLLIALSIVSCTYDVSIDPVYNQHIDIGSYDLLDESLAMLPYIGKAGIIFQDSTENAMTLFMTENQVHTGMGTLYRYNVYEHGDTVRYRYTSQSKSFSLKNDSLGLNYLVQLRAEPYYADPTEGFVADVLSILRQRPDMPTYLTQVFSHIVARRSWPLMSSFTKDLGTISVFGREYHNVLVLELSGSDPVIYFNYESGIVALTDHDGKTWRFDRFLQ